MNTPHMPARVSKKVASLSSRGQFTLFLTATIVITAALTVLSYTLYVVSGTAQLDLSRPGYKQALSEVSPTNNDDSSFSPTGPLDRRALNDFKQKYDELAGKTKGYSAFDPNALSDDQLNLNDPGAVGPQ